MATPTAEAFLHRASARRGVPAFTVSGSRHGRYKRPPDPPSFRRLVVFSAEERLLLARLLELPRQRRLAVLRCPAIAAVLGGGGIFGGTAAKARTNLASPPTVAAQSDRRNSEGWGIGPATSVSRGSRSRCQRLQAAQLRELLKKLPDGMTFELSLEKEEG